jgi:hypothetical protein
MMVVTEFCLRTRTACSHIVLSFSLILTFISHATYFLAIFVSAPFHKVKRSRIFSRWSPAWRIHQKEGFDRPEV